MSKCTQDSQKFCIKLLSILDNAKIKTQFLVPQLKLKFAPSPSLHPMSDHIINTHTNQVKTLRMDCPGNTSIPLYRPKRTFDLKTVICLCWVIKKKIDTPSPKPTKTESSSIHPQALQNYVCFFPLTSRPRTYAHKHTPCHCP